VIVSVADSGGTLQEIGSTTDVNNPANLNTVPTLAMVLKDAPGKYAIVKGMGADNWAGIAARKEDPEIVAFLTGNAAGMIPTTTIGMTAIIELLLARPLWWDRARRLAAQIRGAGPAGDPAARKQLLDILMEAARLSPTLYPGQFRLAGRDAVIAPGTLRASRVRQGDLLMVSTASALQDGRRFKWPGAFNPDRPTAEKQAAELMFGAGVHKCVGIHLAKAVMLEIAVALVLVLSRSWPPRSPRSRSTARP
jgi:cytochrome P450